MKTTQPLPQAVRTMCKYDWLNYREYLQAVYARKGEKISDAYGKRCAKVVNAVDLIMTNADGKTKKVLNLVYLRRHNISVEAAADILGIGKTQAYLVINKALIEYATSMGYVQKREKIEI